MCFQAYRLWATTRSVVLRFQRASEWAAGFVKTFWELHIVSDSVEVGWGPRYL